LQLAAHLERLPMLASVESFLGSLWFGLLLGMTGLVAGFIYCRRSKK
jgi:hypothetical protein